MSSRVSQAVQSYTTLTSSLLERWGELASGAASRAEAGRYTPASAAGDAAAGALLGAEAGWRWAMCWWDVFAELSGLEAEERIVKSHPFHAPAGATLEIAGSLLQGPGMEGLPADAVTVQPEQLAAGETEFTIRVDAGGCHGATYVGEVNATTGQGEPEKVVVWITVA